MKILMNKRLIIILIKLKVWDLMREEKIMIDVKRILIKNSTDSHIIALI